MTFPAGSAQFKSVNLRTAGCPPVAFPISLKGTSAGRLRLSFYCKDAEPSADDLSVTTHKQGSVQGHMTQEQPSLLLAGTLLWLYWALQCLYTFPSTLGSICHHLALIPSFPSTAFPQPCLTAPTSTCPTALRCSPWGPLRLLGLFFPKKSKGELRSTRQKEKHSRFFYSRRPGGICSGREPGGPSSSSAPRHRSRSPACAGAPVETVPWSHTPRAASPWRSLRHRRL